MIDNIGNINKETISGLNASRSEQAHGVSGFKKNPYASYNRDFLIDESRISKDAIRLYEMEKDVKKFTRLAMSDIEDDDTTDALMQNLFAKGVIDPQSDDVVGELSANKRLWDDILG